jgi:hypothetical protein
MKAHAGALGSTQGWGLPGSKPTIPLIPNPGRLTGKDGEDEALWLPRQIGKHIGCVWGRRNRFRVSVQKSGVENLMFSLHRTENE